MKEAIVFNKKMPVGEVQLRLKRSQKVLCPTCGGLMELWSKPNLELPGSPMGIFCSVDASHDPVVLGYPSTTASTQITKKKSN